MQVEDEVFKRHTGEKLNQNASYMQKSHNFNKKRQN